MFAGSLGHWASVLALWTTLSRGRVESLSPRANRLTVALFESWAQLLALNVSTLTPISTGNGKASSPVFCGLVDCSQ